MYQIPLDSLGEDASRRQHYQHVTLLVMNDKNYVPVAELITSCDLRGRGERLHGS